MRALLGVVLLLAVAGSAAASNSERPLFRRADGSAIFSTLRPSTYPVYPDSDKVGANRKYFRMGDAVDYWDGEGP